MEASLPGARASKRKIFIRISMILVSLAALFFLIVVPWFVARMVMTRRFSFPDPDAGKTPASYGLQFDGIEFQSRDGLTLRGWYVPVNSRDKGSVIFAHGLNRSRVEFLDQAVFVHELGYNALLFDFRHQGRAKGASPLWDTGSVWTSWPPSPMRDNEIRKVPASSGGSRWEVPLP